MDKFTVLQSFIRSAAGFPSAYEKMLCNAEDVILSLGNPGREFLEKMLGSGFTEMVMEIEGAVGVGGWFASYPHHSDSWWEDDIPASKGNSAFQYNADELNLRSVFGLKVHEGIHGLQSLSGACVHASPINFRSPIVLSPYDKILVWEVYERDAYAKQAWFMYLASRHEQFQDLRASTHVEAYLASQKGPPKPEAVFMKTSQYLMNNYMVSNRCGGVETLRENTHRAALENYEMEFELRRSKGGPRGNTPAMFVRLEEEDLAAIPSGFGPNFMKAIGRNYQAPLGVLSADNKKWLETIEREFGIGDRSALPTFKEALKALDMSPQAYIAMSMCRPINSVPLGPKV